jgi:hypothetical protein
MSVKLRKLRGSWYIVLIKKAKPRKRKIGGTLEYAREVARQIQEKLTRGDLGVTELYMGHFGISKTHECRRVDMSKQLRAVLTTHKESALLRAFQLGKTSVADDLVFPSKRELRSFRTT